MAKGNADKFVSIAGGKLTLGQSGNYTFDFSGSNVVISRGSSTSLTDAQFAALTSFDLSAANKINLTGIAFTDAEDAANHKFEPDQNVDKLLKSLLASVGVAGTVDLLSVDGGKAGVFQLIWDYIDDNYSYYDTVINGYGLELGLAYADYLQDGGTPLTGVVAKYVVDGGDVGTAPDRYQSIHDNMLGNLDINSIIDKFFDGNSGNGSPDVPAGYFAGGSNATPDEVLGQALLDKVFAEGLGGRPYYGGSEGSDAGPTILWDQQHGLLP